MSQQAPPALPDGQNTRIRVNAPPQKYSSFRNLKLMIYRNYPARMRGETRRHDSWCGLRWTWKRADDARQSGRQRRVVLIPRRWDQANGIYSRRRLTSPDSGESTL